jgi:hypothetical protein
MTDCIDWCEQLGRGQLERFTRVGRERSRKGPMACVAKSTSRIGFDGPIVQVKRAGNGESKQPDQAQIERQPPPFELCRMP